MLYRTFSLSGGPAVSPVLLLLQGIFIYTLTDITPTEYNGYVFPWWADMLGWFMGASTLVPFIVGIAYRYFKDKPVSGKFRGFIASGIIIRRIFCCNNLGRL